MMFLAHPRRDYTRPPEPDYWRGIRDDIEYQAPEPDQPTRWRWVWLAVLILLPVTVAFINGKG